MSLLFSSHLLPDVEAVCEYVMVLGRGRLLAQGRIADLKQAHNLEFELRVKGDPAHFSGRLAARGITAEPVDDHLAGVAPAGHGAGRRLGGRPRGRRTGPLAPPAGGARSKKSSSSALAGKH